MAAAAEAITDEAMLDVTIIIMATIATEIIITMPDRYLSRVVKIIEINHNPTNREYMDPLKTSSRETWNRKEIAVEAAEMGNVFGRGRW